MPFILRPTVSATFLERITETPRAVAFRRKIEGHWKKSTFRDFGEDCERISGGLRALGVQPGDRVGIYSKTRYEWAVSDLSVIAARAVTVPLYSSASLDEVTHVAAHSGVRVIFAESRKELGKLASRASELKSLEAVILFNPEGVTAEATAPLPWKVLGFDALTEKGREEHARAPEAFAASLQAARPEDLISICYTSGTTGVPKGAMISHENLMSVLTDCHRVYAKHVTPEDEELLTFLPFSHIMGKVELMSTFVFGWTESFAESVEKVDENLQEIRPTILFSVPRIFEKARARIEQAVSEASSWENKLFHHALEAGRRTLARKAQGLAPNAIDSAEYAIFQKSLLKRIADGFGGRLKFAICGGAPLPRDLAEYFHVLGILILEGYGLTETSAPVALNTPENFKFGSVGKPLPEVEVRTAPDGEILIKSSKVTRGYYRDDKETRASFNDGWFHTGDVGHIDSQGYLWITDRKKDLIITSGAKNIAPQKIEARMKSESSLIAHFVTVGDRRKYLTALVSLDRERLKAWAIQEHILFSDYPELTRNIKLQSVVQGAIDRVNSRLAKFETIKKFVILPDEFSVQGGELTPTLKVRRNQVLEKYATHVESLYTDSHASAS